MGYAELENLPSGKRLHNYGKSQFFMGKSTISMAISNSYVKLPEGTKHPKLLNHRSESLPNYRNTPRLQVLVKWLGWCQHESHWGTNGLPNGQWLVTFRELKA